MRRVLVALLLTALLGSGLAGAEGTTEDGAEPSQAFGVTITCSARLPTAVVGCFLERDLFRLGPLSVTLGVDAQAALGSDGRGHLAPYALAAWYSGSWGAWVEVRLPELNGLKPLGDPDWLRLGFSLTL